MFYSQADASEPYTRPRVRATHTKSRNGCHICKLRRVKRARQVEEPDPPTTASASGEDLSDNTTTRGQERCSRSLQPLEFNVPARPPTSLLPPARPGTLNTCDLRLLQHFLAHTSKNMSFHPKRTLVWQRVIPDMASKEEYIMHLLLALAGAHLLTTQTQPSPCTPDEQPSQSASGTEEDSNQISLNLVIEHHQDGLRGFREALSTMSSSTADYVFCGSVLLVAFAFASLRIRGLTGSPQLPAPESELPANETPRLDWLHLLRGLTSVVGQHWPTLKTGRLRSMMFYTYGNEGRSYESPLSLSSSSFSSDFPRLKGCSPRIVRFALGATQALLYLRRCIHPVPEDMAATTPTSHQSTTSCSGESARVVMVADNDILREQGIALDLLEETYSRILHVLQFTESEQDCSADIDIQGDLEEAAVTAWPHGMLSTFISSLEEGQGVVGWDEAVSV
ncbi:hypothetical protein FE257_011389 [Aspergillus nanangensis]|uniref:Uncharacterized protein n=1 Tax=Aspergillus nanangensis TaxID=2582783 RepID=A0AAD4GRF1_ASPNN|nr:hypothetical protein FE257_011389 [Aspergillus nanangensis]